MYRKSFSTLGSPELNLEQAIRLAAKFQLESVELRVLAARIDLPQYLAETFGSPDALKQWMQHQPVKVGAIGTSFRLMGSSVSDRVALLEFVPWAEALGVPYLRIFDGGTASDGINWREAEATLDWWRAIRSQRSYAVDVMVETHDRLFTGQQIARLIALVPGVKVLWDSHHTWKKGREAPSVTWAAIADSVVHLHVKDSVAVSANEPDAYRYVNPGRGEFPMADLRSVLGSFAGTVSLEWERYWVKTLPPVESALDSAAKLNWW